MSRCDDSLCNLLDRFRGQNVTIITRDDDVIQGELLGVSNCVVGVLEPANVSPFTEAQLTLIRCEDIARASVTVTGITPDFGFDNDNDNGDESPESS